MYHSEVIETTLGSAECTSNIGQGKIVVEQLCTLYRMLQGNVSLYLLSFPAFSRYLKV